MFNLIKLRSFQLSLFFVLIAHAVILFYSVQENMVQKASLSISNQSKNIQLKFRTKKKPVVKKKVVKKVKKLAKKARKVVKKEEEIVQKIEKVQAAIMKTVFNSKSSYMPKPRYPRRARKRGIQGKAFVSILISESGVPYDVKLLTSSGHKILDDAALKAALEWRFNPALQNGKAVKSVNNQTFVFSLQNR